MGLAIDTIGFSATAPGSTYTAVTYSPGDSPVVRAYAAGSSATLEAITRSGATGGDIRVRSPLLHDNVQGIRLRSSERVSHWLMPRELGQVLQLQDTLTIELTGGTTSEVDAGAILIYYSNLRVRQLDCILGVTCQGLSSRISRSECPLRPVRLQDSGLMRLLPRRRTCCTLIPTTRCSVSRLILGSPRSR